MNRAMTLVVGFLLIGVALVSGSGIIYLTNSAGSSVVLSVTPAIVDTSIGGSFAVTVNVSNVRDLGKWEMAISWNASVMDLDQSSGDAVAEGPFLRSANAPTKFQLDPYMSGSGVLSGVSCVLLQARGASGSGSLVQVRFKAVGKGETPITIAVAKLYDYVGRVIIPSPLLSPGQVFVSSGSDVHDISVTSFEYPHNVSLGDQVQLNVTVKNKGTVNEANVEVELLIDDYPNQSDSIPELAVGDEEPCKFSWRPASERTYNLTIHAIPLLGETNIVDNSNSCVVVVSKPIANNVVLSFDPQPPDQASLGESVWLNATVLNEGPANLTNVTVTFYVDFEPQQNSTLGEVAKFTSGQASYRWEAFPAGAHTITANVTYLVSSEPSSRQCAAVVRVSTPFNTGKILIVSDDVGANQVGYRRGTSLPEFKAALGGDGFDVWSILAQGHPSLSLLEQYCLVIWTCGDYNDYSGKVPNRADADILERYLTQGGNILLEGQRVCWLRTTDLDKFARNVIHANHVSSSARAPLKVRDTNHPITANLPLDINWSMEPVDGADGVAPANGGEEVIAFGDYWMRSAVTVFDGAEKGVGRVVCCSFPLYWLPLNERNALAWNSVHWLTRFGIDNVGGRIANAATGSVHFVYTQPDEVGASATFDAAAGALAYSICRNSQEQGFVSNERWFLPSGAVNHDELNNSIIVIVGNARFQLATEHFETMNRTVVGASENLTHYVLQSRNGGNLAAILKTDVQVGEQDLIVVQTFKDLDNTVLIMYGFSWRGTWAAGMYFAEEMAKDFSSYPNSYYVLQWEDNSGDGVPQISEIGIICSG